jgi:hypothetical protein
MMEMRKEHLIFYLDSSSSNDRDGFLSRHGIKIVLL